MKAKIICPECGETKTVDLEEFIADIDRRIDTALNNRSLTEETARKIRARNDIGRMKKSIKKEGPLTCLCDKCQPIAMMRVLIASVITHDRDRERFKFITTT